MARLDEIGAQLPTSAGVYLWKDKRGRVLYVGKAINLRARVRQYLSGHDERQMVPHLVRLSHDIDVVVTSTEKEALLLENTLIKKHRPRFNVKLRDDSNFLHLRLDLSDAWPRYRLVRTIKSDGAKYFGPYTSAQKARKTLTWLQRAFPMRTCSDAVLKSRSRPCMLHQMGRCVAPCVDLVDEPTYQQIAEDSTYLLSGHTKPAIASLEKRMFGHADKEEFEAAARLRDLIASIRATVEKQQVIDPRLSDRDVWGLYRQGWSVALVIVPIREGMMQEPIAHIAESVVEDDPELLSSAMNSAYAEGTPIPPEILVPTMPSSHEDLASVLSDRAGRKVRILQPQRGNKTRLIELAATNARVRFQHATDADTQRANALQELADAIGLPHPPHRMECFDNSHLNGTNPVAGMAVFIDGQPDRSEYRNYKLKEAPGGDDYAGMREVLSRRFRRALESGVRPDLLVIDGGKGQLGVALAVLEDLGIDDQAVIGLSKPRTEHKKGDRAATDKIVLPHAKDPIRLPSNHPGLRMLQHLRDQTHDHAVSFQRKTRRKQTLTSVLEGIPGVGPARRKALIKHLGSAKGVLRADVDALAEVPGIGPAVAQTIYDAVHRR